MNILITGAFGFVGRNLSAYLAEKGHELWALDVEMVLTETQRAQSVHKKCFNWEQLDDIPWGGIDAVVHLAGKAHDTKNTSDPQSYFDVNVGLTKKIVGAFLTANHANGANVRDGDVSRQGAKTQSGARSADGGRSSLVGEDGALGSRGNGEYRTVNIEHRTSNGGDASAGAVSSVSTNERMNSRTNQFPKFILFSSVKAVADRVEGVLTEEALPEPKTPYGQSKLAAERVVGSSFVHYCESSLVGETPVSYRQSVMGNGESSHRGTERTAGGEGSSFVHYCDSSLVGEDGAVGGAQSAGSPNLLISQPATPLSPASNLHTNELTNSRTNELSYYILRPCMIHGPGNKGNLNLLYGMVRKGVPWPLGAFENRRSFASVGNVCAVVEGLLAGEVESGVYQVADDEPLSTSDLVRLMADVMGRRARVWAIPAGLIRAAARLGDALHLPLNSERLKKLTESYVVSNAKVKRALGWEKMPVAAREGMRKTLESFGERSLTEAQRPQRVEQ